MCVQGFIKRGYRALVKSHVRIFYDLPSGHAFGIGLEESSGASTAALSSSLHRPSGISGFRDRDVRAPYLYLCRRLS